MATERFRIRMAPGGLALVQEVLNTRAVGQCAEDLLAGEAAGLGWLRATVRGWAEHTGVAGPAGEPGAADLDSVRDLRAWLTELVRPRGGPTGDGREKAGSGGGGSGDDGYGDDGSGNGGSGHDGSGGGGPGNGDGVEVPRRVAAELRVGGDGAVRLVPPPVASWGHWLESAVWAEVLLAQRAGNWPRLKLCREPVCESAFYDLSRNNSAVWHDVKVCGNAANLRASRLRKKQQAGEDIAGKKFHDQNPYPTVTNEDS